jgi:hypothetical protein
MSQIALASTPDGGVDVWCDVTKVCPDGRVMFWVINGAWDGSFYPDQNQLSIDDQVFVRNKGKRQPAFLVWEGKAPFEYNDYNSAIAWIEEQVARHGKPDTQMWRPDMDMWMDEMGYDSSYIFGDDDA